MFQVSPSGLVVIGKWALCQDERTIIYDGSGAGQFCPMPFLYNHQFFDTCTRKNSNLSLGLEPFYWCPNPNSVDPSQQNLFTPGGNIGKCNTFLFPQGNFFPFY